MEHRNSKMETLGFLSAGIAHEIQNPLNFVINFSKLSEKLLEDMNDVIDDIREKIDEDDAEDLLDIADNLAMNMQKIKEHGERAVSIIQGILLISRGKEGEKLPTDVAKLVHEYVYLSYHARRANDKSFNITINEDYQQDVPKVMVIPQDLSRAVVNVMNNACYAVQQREKIEAENGEEYKPFVQVKVLWEKASDSDRNGMMTISFADNGTGMPEEVQKVLFKDMVTTKPVGEGTGLGMKITHDIIVNNHGGNISFESVVGKGTTFTFRIPCEIVS